MPYLYILHSHKDGNLYTGSAIDLRERIRDHNAGQTPSTKYRRPLELVYFEEHETLIEARLREKELKRPTKGKYKRALIAAFPKSKLNPFL